MDGQVLFVSRRLEPTVLSLFVLYIVACSILSGSSFWIPIYQVRDYKDLVLSDNFYFESSIGTNSFISLFLLWFAACNGPFRLGFWTLVRLRKNLDLLEYFLGDPSTWLVP